MALTIPIAHDFICPWCWVGLLQAKRLRYELNVDFDWQGYELFPDELEWPNHAPAPEVKTNRPPTPTRFEFLLLADGLEMPTSERPKGMRTHNAHEAVEYAKTLGRGEEMLETLYIAYWRSGQNINDVEVLSELAQPLVKDLVDFRDAVASRRFKANIVGFDDDAYSKGVYNVPTFFIGGERYAEQPYSVLHKKIKAALNEH